MSKNAKRAYVSLSGLIGLIALLVGIFLHVYDFGVGLIIAIACWVGSGILAKYWEVKKEESK
jgi:hypothetical protein